MSYDLCLPNRARQPYYIESIRTGIYSLEELCFYFHNNSCLIDESIINEKLLDWIRDELQLPRLYRQLYDVLERTDEAKTAHFVLSVFREVGYLTGQQMREYQEELDRLRVQSEETKQKIRGDYLVREKLFARAIWEYRHILQKRNPGKLGSQFYAAVYSNLGCAYAGLFRFSEAAECFWEAYRLMRTKENLRKYVSALPLFMEEKAYQQRIRELERQESIKTPEAAEQESAISDSLIRSIQEHNAKLCRRPEFLQKLEKEKERDAREVEEELRARYCRSAKT